MDQPLVLLDEQIGTHIGEWCQIATVTREEVQHQVEQCSHHHNLFTGANKSSYIDTFLDRSVNALQFVEQVRAGLDGQNTNWYLQ